MLLPLWEQDGRRMGGLAERARLSKQTMTTLVRLAEPDGLVRRAPDPLDGRATRVWLTPPAIDFAPAAADVADDLQARATDAIGDLTIQALNQALHEGRLEDALALYEPDAVSVAQPGTSAITGRERIRDALQGLAALRPLLSADIRNVIVLEMWPQ